MGLRRGPGDGGGAGKGQGRKKGTHAKTKIEVAIAARKYSKAALKVLVEIMNDKDAPEAARLTAANAVLDRAHGRPIQAMQHGGEDGNPIVIKFDAVDKAT